MSITKRVWLERDPQYREVRDQFAKQSNSLLVEYVVGAPLRRRNRLAESPHWDPLWAWHLEKAARELGLSQIVVNARMMFRDVGDRDAAVMRAERSWEEDIARRKSAANLATRKSGRRRGKTI